MGNQVFFNMDATISIIPIIVAVVIVFFICAFVAAAFKEKEQEPLMFIILFLCCGCLPATVYCMVTVPKGSTQTVYVHQQPQPMVMNQQPYYVQQGQQVPVGWQAQPQVATAPQMSVSPNQMEGGKGHAYHI